jgi:peptidoglycan/xylan/chitin deacetylase (PgdA/CDA1 family)
MATGTGGIPRRSFLAVGAAVLLSACGSAGGDGGGGEGEVPAGMGPGGTGPTPTGPTSTGPTSTGPTTSARFVDRGPAAARRVALTFHTDGDLTSATQLLDVLERHDTVMTAFVVGEWLDANPSWGRRLVAAGHEVANHTFTHPTFAALAPDAMRDEIERCRAVLERDAGTPGALFRPSGTGDGTAPPPESVLQAAAAGGYDTVLGFDVDPLDYDEPGADVVAQRVLAGLQPGSVVSLHFGYPGTIAAMPTILDGLAARDLTCVTGSELVG